MLFDTSSPGRKRGVQVIFSALAILMAGGLILFGIGSNQAFNPFTEGSGSSASSEYRKQAEQAQEALEVNAKDEAAALKLARANAQIASVDAIDPTTGQIVEDGGQELIDEAIRSWQAYLKLGPAKPDPGVALQYSNFFAQPTVAQYDQAARAIEAALVTRKPTSGLYAQLAIFHLVAGDTEKYSTARSRALELAENADRRDQIREYLDEIKADVDKQQKAAAEQAAEAGGEGAEGTTPTLPTLPTLQ